jgi:hypothetical protein
MGELSETTSSMNPPVVRVPAGQHFVIYASFAHRHLGALSVSDSVVQPVCSINVSGLGGGPSTIFVAHHQGSTLVSTETDDCSGCADLRFAISVVVTAEKS